MQYRPAVDGLRAVAVLPVILFHAGFDIFSGGFVGVDVFFVISGYLIAALLIADLQQGRFSLIGFYDRRARRILPALVFVVLCCLPFAFLWLQPSQMVDFGQSLVAVGLFFSNFLFWKEGGYFAAAAELKPLLHTWSLAVEEQYYLLFPVFLALIWRVWRGGLVWALGAIALGSFAWAIWGWPDDPDARFYLAPSRVWELLLGALVAVWPVRQTGPLAQTASLAGLVMILVSIFVYDYGTPFPSIYTVLPVLGAAAILVFAGPETWVGRLLGWRPFVAIGLLSYSAYLWHQPLFAFARLRSLTEPSAPIMAGLAALSLLLAALTWRWVETPFRNPSRRFLTEPKAVLAASAAVCLVLVTIGLALQWDKGLTARFSAENLAMLQTKGSPQRCTYKPDLPHLADADCTFSASGHIDALIIGDSHAGAVALAWGAALEQAHIPAGAVSRASCVPLQGFRPFHVQDAELCPSFNHDVIAYARRSQVKTLILVARYPLSIHGAGFDNGEGGVEERAPACTDEAARKTCQWDDPSRQSRLLSAYKDQISELAKQFNVVLVYPIPEAGWHVPQYMFKNAQFNGRIDVLTTDYAAYTARAKPILDLFDQLVATVPNVYAARVQEALCNAETGRCLNADAQGIYYFDDDHPSPAGAKLMAPILVRAVQQAEGR